MAQVRHVERVWLEAARNGDVDQMKMLRQKHPQWLDLERVDNAADGLSGDISRSSGFCSWDGFHLHTIGASALHTATWHGEDKIVRYLLAEGQDSDTEDDSGTSAVMLSIMHHNLQATRCVFRDRVAIQRNLVMDCRQEEDERTRRTVEMIQLFMRFNADVDKRCQLGKTALHHATTDETYHVAKLLLSNGASVDAQDKEGRSPLVHSIQSSSLLVANLLLQHGANLYLPDNDGITPLQLVEQTHDVNMLQVFLNHHQLVPTIEGEDFAGSVLMTAIDEGAIPIVEYLLEETYTAIDHQNKFGETPMHRAILNRNDAVTELLRSFDDQARVMTLHTNANESCLHFAARYSSPRELQRLLDFYYHYHGAVGEEEGTMALLNDTNSAGSTALFLAAISKSDSLDDRNAKTRLMLDAGARLFGRSPFRATRSSLSTMVLSTQVQSCLCLWLSEIASSQSITRFDAVSKFCMKYLAIICSFHHPLLQMNHEVLEVLLSSRQAVDTVPLLFLLPFDPRASLPLLEHIGVFGRQQNHSLMLALYEELAAAWTGLAA